MPRAAPMVTVIGAGVAGLVAAIELARQGLDVTVLERAATPGGKMREVPIGTARLDAGPTVFTMRHVFDEIFEAAGTTLDAHVTLRRADLLARHAWDGGGTLDLFADPARSAAAIGDFAGAAAAQGFLAFCARARQVHATLEAPFMHAARPTPLSLLRAAGLRALWRIAPFSTLWQALGEYFPDPRLRQLFARYATYSGASPFQAPATLMLIAHVEQSGVWLVDGGMHRLARALAALALRHGARIGYGAEAVAIRTRNGRVAGVTLAGGEELPADAVVVNADTAALAAGLFGKPAARAVPSPRARSLSAVTWSIVGRTAGFPLARHTVFFSRDYRAEFDDIFTRRRLPDSPTAYVCAQDRDDAGGTSLAGPERLLCLVNAPANGGTQDFSAKEIAACEDRTFGLLARCGLTVERDPARMVTTTPAGFARLFPGSAGALYGPAMHGAMAAFRRPGAATAIPGLYLAGGSVHPGPGVPMAAISGRLAAARLLADLPRQPPTPSPSTATSRATATPGGISTR